MGLLASVKNPEKNDLPLHHPDFQQSTVYGSSFASTAIPKYEMAEESMPAGTVYQLIKDELELDGTPSLNLASFVTTYMEPEIEKLMAEHAHVNFIDYEEYPATADLQARSVAMIARLFNAPLKSHEEAVGVSTVGSSEAIILAVLAMKKKWKKARQAEGKSTEHPNLVMNSAVQVCWEKATRYLEIDEKFVYCTADRNVIDPKQAIDLVDENTIGVVGILGTTYTGEYEDIVELARLLDEKYEKTGLDVNIHVDAASGGFVAPFVNPDLVWDFRIPRVVSINVSGHKYGLVSPGVGWAVWRSKDFLPEELVFHVAYLGADQASFTLNFSKSAQQVIAQYAVLIRYGKAGFRSIMSNVTNTADYVAEELTKTGRFTIISQGGGKGLPLIAFKMKDKKHYDVFAIASQLRQRNWILPAYSLAPKAEEVKILRIVCRSDFSRSRAELLLRDLEDACKTLDNMSKETIEQTGHHALAARKKKHADRGGVRHHGKEGKKEVDKVGAQDAPETQGNDGTKEEMKGKTHAVC